MSRNVKIIITESSDVIRRGLVSILGRLHPFHAEISEASDFETLTTSLARGGFDIIIINQMIAGPQLKQLQKEAPAGPVKFVGLQTSLADSAVLRSFDASISLYDSADQIREKIIKLIRRPDSDTRHQTLSQREKEVIACVVKGMTNKQIADVLCLSTHTVITHRRNISTKLDIHSTAGLTIYAIVNKLVELEEISGG